MCVVLIGSNSMKISVLFNMNSEKCVLYYLAVNICAELFLFEYAVLVALKHVILDRLNNQWDKLFRNGPSKIGGREPLKFFKLFLQIF